MTNRVNVYGFGSAFNSAIAFSDIDILIIHNNTDQNSCRFAIKCKSFLREKLEDVHVTILSKKEEVHFQFIETAKAIFLGLIRECSFEFDTKELLIEIQKNIPTGIIKY